ncbi:hypothetical protein IE53DRAFT_388802 [Violaceomyces palustris]|uniref:Uncharacterized protein n=1 Tax=Violaceomyces palustris TaxID=1673888 RepID=A0ACD0NT70_9BASI|nr:hypothetical protein IE53DRAFT_388802 [Violaceomyces palustris]
MQTPGPAKVESHDGPARAAEPFGSPIPTTSPSFTRYRRVSSIDSEARRRMRGSSTSSSKSSSSSSSAPTLVDQGADGTSDLKQGGEDDSLPSFSLGQENTNPLSLKGITRGMDSYIRDQASKDTYPAKLVRRFFLSVESPSSSTAPTRVSSPNASGSEDDERPVKRERIGGMDSLWLLLSNLSGFNPVCTATYTFTGKVEQRELVHTLERQCQRFPRYRQKLANYSSSGWQGRTFVDVENFRVEDHILFDTLPGQAGKDELEEYTSRFIAKDWDLERPLWELAVLTNYSEPSTGAVCAMVVRGHHTLSDGQGFILSQLMVTSCGPKLERMMSEGAKMLNEAKRGKVKPSKVNRGLKPLDRFQDTLPLRLLMLCLFWILLLHSFLSGVVGSIRMAIDLPFFYLLNSWRSKHVTDPYPGPRVEEREFSTSSSFPISDVKKIQKAFSGVRPGSVLDKIQGGGRHSRPWIGNHLTLNDVLCAVISDVVADELHQRPKGMLERAADTLGLTKSIGFFIPISIRKPGDLSMVNLSTGGLAYLPTPSKPLSESSQEERRDPNLIHSKLHRTSKRLRLVKEASVLKLFFHLADWLVKRGEALPQELSHLFFGSRQGPNPRKGGEDVLNLVLGGVGVGVGGLASKPPAPVMLLKQLVEKVTEVSLTCFTAVITNVPCPTEKRITMAGQEVVKWTALPPQAGKGTLGIGICTYGEQVSISISADRVKGTDSEGVATRLTRNFDKRWKEYLESSDIVLGNNTITTN